MLNAGRAAQKSLNPADPVVRPRTKSNHNRREKLCPLLLVVHPSAMDAVHVSFQFQEECRLGACWNQRFPHATEREVLTAPWRLGSPGARGRLPSAVADRFLTLLSIRCQRRSGRAKATVLRLVRGHQVYSAQAVALASIELARPTTTPWNGSGNAMKPWEHLSQTVMAFTSSSTSRCS